MNVLTINKLTLKNFKGIKDFTLEPNGNTSVFGDNGTGKTTVQDGVSWLFFGKDSQGKSDFQLKPVTKDGQERHNLETEVEGGFEYNNKTIVLRKRFYEKYTKKRGTAKQEFTGHTTDYFIDGVPAKKKGYDSKIAEIIDINAFKLVTNPMEFNHLHWTARRQILLEMCGDVTDQDVIDSDKNLKGFLTSWAIAPLTITKRKFRQKNGKSIKNWNRSRPGSARTRRLSRMPFNQIPKKKPALKKP